MPALSPSLSTHYSHVLVYLDTTTVAGFLFNVFQNAIVYKWWIDLKQIKLFKHWSEWLTVDVLRRVAMLLTRTSSVGCWRCSGWDSAERALSFYSEQTPADASSPLCWPPHLFTKESPSKLLITAFLIFQCDWRHKEHWNSLSWPRSLFLRSWIFCSRCCTSSSCSMFLWCSSSSCWCWWEKQVHVLTAGWCGVLVRCQTQTQRARVSPDWTCDLWHD